MKKRTLKHTLAVLTATMILTSSMTAFAAPKTMPDGQTFDPQFYAATYPDVKAALGTDENALYNHYITYGKKEGRLPFAGDNAVQKAATSSVSQKALDSAKKAHNYYSGIDADSAASADAVAKSIADSILADASLTTDLAKINRAAQTVAGYCNKISYGADSAKYYRSPAGVFLGKAYTCAGSTRALGRVLDYMGYSWTHTNENQMSHQWCIVTMDGQTGFADGMGGFAGYGEMTSGMTLADGTTIYFR